ncbi:MAG TPA: hypothetical protein PLX89_03845 [Verrucomicrobiota bacterium]|nr:hypothetical protein [Verrucomicrobiales bacterium]HRI12116.1 hypothetical protein [Verrucomicrobiota bacterium]
MPPSSNFVLRWFCRPKGLAVVPLLLELARVLAAEQTLTWTDPGAGAVLRVGQVYPLVASASSGLPVTFRVAAGPAIISGETISVTNVGTVILVAKQAGDATYSPVTQTRRLNQVAVHLTRVGGYDTPGNAAKVEVVGSRAYVSDSVAGVQIFDVGDPTTPVLLGSSGSGTFSSVQVVGHLAYVAGGDAGFEILDVSNPAAPTRVGGSDLSGSAVQVVDGLAYLAGREGLQILDVTIPTAPIVGTHRTDGDCRGVRVLGNLAYLSAGSSGLQVLDITIPSTPKQLSGYGIKSGAWDSDIVGGLAFVASYMGGIQVLDVSNPQSPSLVGTYSQSDRALTVQVVDELAFVADATVGLVILDVAEPTSPVRVGSFPFPQILQNIKVVGNHAYLADGTSGLIILRVDRGVAQTLDWAQPANDVALLTGESSSFIGSASSGLPVTYRVVTGPGEIANGVLTATNFGTVVIEAEQAGDATYLPVKERRAVNPVGVALTRVGSYNIGGVAFGVQVVGNLAYVAVADGEEGLKILDVSDPTRPVLVGSFDTSEDAFTVQVVGSRAYLAADAAGLIILDVSNPSSPRLLGENSIASEAYVVRVVGDLAYVADNTNGLLIFDVSDPTAPKLKSNLNLGPAFSVEPVGDLAYVAGPMLNIFNVKNPEVPTLISRFRVSIAHDVQVIGNLAFVAKGDGLEIIDVRLPQAPWFVGNYQKPVGFGFAVHVVDNLAFLASEGGGLHVVDVSQPEAPRAAGSFMARDTWDVQVVGDLAYLADGAAGLQILRLEKRIAQTLSLGIPSTLSRLQTPFVLPRETSRGLTVSYKVFGPAEIVNGNELMLIDRGQVVVQADQTGNEHFAPLTLRQTFMALFPPLMEPARLEEGRLVLSWTGGSPPFVVLERASLSGEPRAISRTSDRSWTVDTDSYYGSFYQVRDCCP